jgi:DNA-binding response OmpR family regulator
VTVDGDEAVLTALEYNILKLLMQNMERVFSSSQLYEAVWDEPAFDVAKTVSVHIRHIREKIEINPKEPRYLKVIYGLGYKVVKLP